MIINTNTSRHSGRLPIAVRRLQTPDYARFRRQTAARLQSEADSDEGSTPPRQILAGCQIVNSFTAQTLSSLHTLCLITQDAHQCGVYPCTLLRVCGYPVAGPRSGTPTAQSRDASLSYSAVTSSHSIQRLAQCVRERRRPRPARHHRLRPRDIQSPAVALLTSLAQPQPSTARLASRRRPRPRSAISEQHRPPEDTVSGVRSPSLHPQPPSASPSSPDRASC